MKLRNSIYKRCRGGTVSLLRAACIVTQVISVRERHRTAVLDHPSLLHNTILDLETSILYSMLNTKPSLLPFRYIFLKGFLYWRAPFSPLPSPSIVVLSSSIDAYANASNTLGDQVRDWGYLGRMFEDGAEAGLEGCHVMNNMVEQME